MDTNFVTLLHCYRMDLLDITEAFPITPTSPVVPVSEASGLTGQVVQKLSRRGLLDVFAYSDTGGNRAEEAVQAAKQLYSQLREAHNLRCSKY